MAIQPKVFMSKTAILLSGEARSFAQCIASQHWCIYRHLKDPHFFASVADDAQASSLYLLEERYPGRVHVEFVKQPTLPEPHKHYSAHSPYSLSVPVQSVMRQLWAYKRCWEFFLDKAPAHLVEVEPKGSGWVARSDSVPDFSTFIRMRPDLHFSSCEESCSGLAQHPEHFFGLWKSKCGGVNDRFSIMGSTAARAYFTALDSLQLLLDAGCPLHPESIQKAALEAAGCIVHNVLTAEFTTVRIDGRPNQPCVEYPGEAQQFIAALNAMR